MVRRPEGRSDDEMRSLLEAMLHRLELIRQHSEQQVAALRSIYTEVGGLRTDIANLLKITSKEK